MRITSSAVSLNVNDVAASSTFLTTHFGSDPGRVLAIVEQPMILVLSTTQATSLVSTTRHTVEQEIKRGNLTGHFWVIDDAEAE
jgi:hypothetical protein